MSKPLLQSNNLCIIVKKVLEKQ